MSKHRILMAIVMSFALMGTVAAAHADGKRQQKPDSIVTCHGNFSGGYEVLNVTVPIPVNLDACTFHGPCSPCVRSLEEQGCKVLDATVSSFPPASPGAIGPSGGAGLEPRASFLLSCEKP